MFLYWYHCKVYNISEGPLKISEFFVFHTFDSIPLTGIYPKVLKKCHTKFTIGILNAITFHYNGLEADLKFFLQGGY